MCHHMRTHWRHLANTIELVLPLAQPSPQAKRQIDRISRFRTAHGRKSLYFTMERPFPKKLPLPTGDLDSYLTHDSLGPSEPITQTESQSVQAFFAQMTAECPYTLQWDAPSK